MKYILLIIIFSSLQSIAQKIEPQKNLLSISPSIDQKNPNNEIIINTLKLFLETKNGTSITNPYWLKDDFTKFITPYSGIYNIEHSKYGKNFYKPSLMEIIKTNDSSKYIVKLAFVGYNAHTKENNIRCIYNIVANIHEGHVFFSSYIDYATKDWNSVSIESINYFISPLKNFDAEQAEKQKKDIDTICVFFKCSPINITYYSCTNSIELFQIKGFDYNPLMYISDNGGLAENGNIIFSANKSEHYTHEVVHIYVSDIYPNAPQILNEGIATYLGGSGFHDYQWHKEKLKRYIVNHKLDLNVFVENPYNRLYIDNETPVAYMVGAMICEKIINDYGKEKLFSLLRNELSINIWDLLNQVKITKDNLNNDLLKVLN